MNNKLQVFRREIGINQYELAEVAKVPRYKIQLAEQGIAVLTPTEVDRILRKLGIKVKPVPIWATELIDVEVEND